MKVSSDEEMEAKSKKRKTNADEKKVRAVKCNRRDLWIQYLYMTSELYRVPT